MLDRRLRGCARDDRPRTHRGPESHGCLPGPDQSGRRRAADRGRVFVRARCPCSMSHEPWPACRLGAGVRPGSPLRQHSLQRRRDGCTKAGSTSKARRCPSPCFRTTARGSRISSARSRLPMFSSFPKSGEILFQGGVDDSHDASRASRVLISKPRSNPCARGPPTRINSRPKHRSCKIRR